MTYVPCSVHRALLVTLGTLTLASCAAHLPRSKPIELTAVGVSDLIDGVQLGLQRVNTDDAWNCKKQQCKDARVACSAAQTAAASKCGDTRRDAQARCSEFSGGTASVLCGDELRVANSVCETNVEDANRLCDAGSAVYPPRIKQVTLKLAHVDASGSSLEAKLPLSAVEFGFEVSASSTLDRSMQIVFVAIPPISKQPTLADATFDEEVAGVAIRNQSIDRRLATIPEDATKLTAPSRTTTSRVALELADALAVVAKAVNLDPITEGVGGASVAPIVTMSTLTYRFAIVAEKTSSTSVGIDLVPLSFGASGGRSLTNELQVEVVR